jgi:hypothetical protein
MSEPRDLRELVGDDVSPEELATFERVDRLLRSVPAPPAHVPESVTQAVAAIQPPARAWTRRRVGAALALAAALSALFFGVGFWAAGDDFDPEVTIAMEATAAARGASAEIAVSDRDRSGNFGMELEVSGLPKLPKDGYYVLWLAEDGEYAATCGTFTVDESGAADVYMNASYDFAKFDAFVITAHLPDQPPDAELDWLLKADIRGGRV